MLERALILINILVGSCGGILLLLWLGASLAIFKSKHPRDSWDVALAPFSGVTIAALFVIIPVLGWLYVMGVFS